MSTGEKIALATALVAILGIVAREAHAAAIERKRTQPLVVAHERRAPHFDGNRGDWLATAYLTNDGEGAAFNVRFGIELNDVRYAFRMHREDPGAGNRQRVVRKGEQVPSDASGLGIVITSLEMASAALRGGEPHSGRLYWCRYENATGRTWETRNPADRSSGIDIRRVRASRLRERREQRDRRKSARTGAELEAQARDELLQAFESD